MSKCEIYTKKVWASGRFTHVKSVKKQPKYLSKKTDCIPFFLCAAFPQPPGVRGNKKYISGDTLGKFVIKSRTPQNRYYLPPPRCRYLCRRCTATAALSLPPPRRRHRYTAAADVAFVSIVIVVAVIVAVSDVVAVATFC